MVVSFLFQDALLQFQEKLSTQLHLINKAKNKQKLHIPMPVGNGGQADLKQVTPPTKTMEDGWVYVVGQGPQPSQQQQQQQQLTRCNIKKWTYSSQERDKKENRASRFSAGCRLAKEEKDVQLITNLVVFFTWV